MDLQHSLVRRRPGGLARQLRTDANERLAIAIAATAIVAFLGGAIALFCGVIDARVYVALATLSIALFGATIAWLR